MKIKYYMRGLGTGILVTVIVLTISNNVRSAELKSQIRTLQNEIASNFANAGDVSKESEAQTDAASQSGTEDSLQESSAVQTASYGIQTSESTESRTSTVSHTQAATQRTTAASTSAVTQPATHSSSGNITISFNSVSSSEAAAQLLEQAGLVDNWREFNTYLMNNGYDRKISSGTFTFSGGESYEELATIITGR